MREDVKKILIVSTVSRQFYLFERGNIEVLRDLGYEIHGAANFCDANERLEELNIVRQPFDIQRSPFSPRNIKAYFQLKKIMKEGEYDIVHCHSPMGGVLARLAAKSVGVKKVIYTAHGFHFYKGAPLLNWILYYPIEKHLSRFTNTLITINNEDFMAANKFRAQRVEYVPGIGIDNKELEKNSSKEEIRDIYGIGAKDILVVSVGELNRNKNHSLGLDVVSTLENKAVKYAICGQGVLENELKRKAKNLGIQDQVFFLGYHSNVRAILRSADIFLFPSIREGLSVSLMEAMSEGLPVVASDIRGNRDLIKNNEGGYLCSPNDFKAFSSGLSILVNNGQLREQMGRRNKEEIWKYDENIVKGKMYQVYKEEN